MPVLASGRQVELEHGAQRAVVVEVGGGVRAYSVRSRAVLDGYAADELVTAARGQPLVPWPNRLHGGRYTWDGRTAQVPLDEPEQGNALHGLCRYRNWVPTDVTAHSVTMRLVLHPSPAYPWSLDLAVHYALTDDGLVVENTATNVGAVDAPYAQGAHPYLSVGGRIDDAVLTLPAATRLVTDADQIPVAREAVAGTDYDFRDPRPLSGVQIDHAFTDLVRDAAGRATVVLRSADGTRSVALWAEEGYPYLEIFTGDTLPEPDRRRLALGVEPMTAPPNALVTGQDVLRLTPGASVTRRWGVAVFDA